MGTLASLALMLALLSLMPRNLRPGIAACLTVTLLGAISLGLSFVRGDASPLFDGLRLDALASAAVFTAGLAGLAQRAR
jgi:hypothetical protein